MNMYIIFAVLAVIVCILLILVVLVQNSKGGGLASNFSSSNQYMGVRKTADFLEKTTWTLAVLLLLLSFLSFFSIPSRESGGEDQELKNKQQTEQQMPAESGQENEQTPEQ